MVGVSIFLLLCIAVSGALSAPSFVLVLLSALGIVSAPITFVLTQITETQEERCRFFSAITNYGTLMKIAAIASISLSFATLLAMCLGWRPSNMSSLSGSISGSDTCAICLEEVEMESGRIRCVLPCRHAFHRPCISKWISVKPNCPICSSPIDAHVRRELGEPVRYGIRGNALLRRFDLA